MEQLSQFIMNHLSLVLAFLGILALFLLNELLTQKKRVQEISPQDLVDKINNDAAIVVDIRDKDTFAKGHIIHSVQANVSDFENNKMNKYKDKHLVLVCTKGLQSATTAAKIRSQGYQVLVLRGGITAWQQADMPLVKGKV